MKAVTSNDYRARIDRVLATSPTTSMRI